MEYRTFMVTKGDGDFPVKVHDQFGNWYDSFKTLADAKASIDLEGGSWCVCPNCNAEFAYLNYFGEAGYECSRCGFIFDKPLHPMKQ